MMDLDDLRLRDSPGNEPPLREGRRTAAFWIPAVLLIIGAATAAYVLFGRRDRGIDERAPATASRQYPVESRRPLGGPAENIVVPPLDESDGVVRQLVAAISSHPRVAAWLATDGLIRNFTAVVHDLSAGITPAPRLQVLAPAQKFLVLDRGGDLRVDTRSYSRYDTLADALASVDAGGAARLYGTLKPRIEESYAEQGFPHVPFDRTLERAIVHLLETPVVGDTPSLQPRGAAGFAYADPRLESLSSAQKHMLRMGPRNVRVIQQNLRELAAALGIPADRLPPDQED